jgi:predicted GNAT family acetyltransferase
MIKYMKIEIKKGKDISEKIFRFIKDSREKEYKCKDQKFQKRDHKDTLFFFIKEKNKIVVIGALRDIEMELEKEKYNVYGISGILSIIKGKGYGKRLIKEIIKYLKKNKKTGIGFCGRKNKNFYKKAGLKHRNLFGKKFDLRNPKTRKIKFENPRDVGDGIYYEGKDKFITKLIKSKDLAYYWAPRIKNPHF